MEQRLKAVHEVLDGATVTDVAKRNGVTRQTPGRSSVYRALVRTGYSSRPSPSGALGSIRRPARRVT